MSNRRILVVGTGSIGERHLRCLLAVGQVEVGLAEINEALRQKLPPNTRSRKPSLRLTRP